MHHVGRIFTPIIAFQYDFYIYNYYENANKNLLLFYKTSINHIIILIPHNEWRYSQNKNMTLIFAIKLSRGYDDEPREPIV